MWITYNGEVYNHEALRAELEAKGHTYRSRTDTETILHLYEEEGPDCVARLDGMFAFAIWDARRRQLLLARDRLGVKPLLYALLPQGLVFGSEVARDPAPPGGRSRARRGGVLRLPDLRLRPSADTLFKGIHKLAAAEYMVVRCRRPDPARALLVAVVRGGRDAAVRAMGEEEMVSHTRGAAGRLDREADDVRRPLWGVPLRRRRLLDQRRADGRALITADTHVLDRPQGPPPLRRARLRPDGRRAVRHRPPRGHHRRRRPRRLHPRSSSSTRTSRRRTGPRSPSTS